ncbi:receptor-like protein EIX2 isoform X2 [Prosopis cineraria]|uniref:receptor-like protein EIX2 isoform X2 n=1 Tax=Prosopis cineraria TaxID=364024 RepID=UPI00240F66A4|nr:receptor-like protein EIX2 isoform X2 [Prosopis cineraria]
MNGRSQLQLLDMSYNLLSGGLTNCWMHWKSLVFVSLGGNKLTGKIPPSVSLLSNLKVLLLNKNNLSGGIPLSLKNCQKLEILDVGENKLSGFLPDWRMRTAKILRLRSNQLSGNVPLQTCQLASLTILDFADNKISGSLPACLQNMTAMTFPNSYNGVHYFFVRIRDFTYEMRGYVVVHIKGRASRYVENSKLLHSVDLSRNNMSGKIPPEIFSLTGLQHLNLSHNQFEGNMPNEIRNMKTLESLDLASNQFSGTQFQGFDSQSFMGDPRLCGAPLPKNCSDKEDHAEPVETSDGQEDEFLSCFYIGIGVGFATAFWGVCIAIFFNKNFRHSYFRFLYRMQDKLEMVVLEMNRFH